jgi:tRNA A-37 threonylcarbamoyl transferase component Bud32
MPVYHRAERDCRRPANIRRCGMLSQPVPEDIARSLQRMKLVPPDTLLCGEPLTGGVSSEIWRIEREGGPICAKRALPKLRVAADWRAPVARNLYEARWMRHANAAAPGAAPAVLGQDEEAGILAMEFLSPALHPLWKEELRRGHAAPDFAAQVGAVLARIHAATAGDPAVAAEFPTDPIFYAIRLEPYLVYTARVWPELAPALLALVETTRQTKRALVHGDVSPKNILLGRGPVFLDAECAWWGDPAFDLAFCLNHLLLKCLLAPASRAGFLACFSALAEHYRSAVDWEPAAELEARTARLLPGLLLARVDGKSPVEYISDDAGKAHVRRVAGSLLRDPVERLEAVRAAWNAELAR